jgi:hypothetical protein
VILIFVPPIHFQAQREGGSEAFCPDDLPASTLLDNVIGPYSQFGLPAYPFLLKLFGKSELRV